MPTKCSSVGCKNTYGVNGVSFHNFPKCEKMRRVWVAAMKRANWTPTRNSKLCSAHFTPDSFVYNPLLAENINADRVSKVLKPDAAPTLFSFNRMTPNAPRTAYAKRRRLEVVSEALREDAERQKQLPPERESPAASDTVVPSRNGGTESQLFGMDHTSCTPQAAQLSDACCPTCGRSAPTMASKYIQAHVPKDTRSQYVQTVRVMITSAGTQSEPFDDGLYTPRCSTPVPEVDTDSDSDAGDDHDGDTSYHVADQTLDITVELEKERFHDPCSGKPPVDVVSTPKYLVFEDCLMELFAKCGECNQDCRVKLSRQGTLLTVHTLCRLGHKRTWRSQPVTNGRAVGNPLAGAILFNGESPSRVLRLLSSIGIHGISTRLYFLVQSCFLFPAVAQVWKEDQEILLQEATTRALRLSGDGRCDSPGYSAKYLTYTLFDLGTNKVLHIELVQSNEVGNSVRMELEGLKRAIKFLMDADCNLDALVTDRHVQVRTYMRDSHPEVKHLFDCWHIAKAIKKKLIAASKTRGNESIGPWIKSLVNHLYWCAKSSNEDPQLILPKWVSVANHVADIHTHDSDLFPTCLHEPGLERAWLDDGSDPHMKLSSIVKAPSLMKDMARLSPKEQTYSCETFHSLLNHYAPKMTAYSYHGMEARMRLAAMHYNENSTREQALTRNGEHRWGIRYPKGSYGEATVNPVKEPATYGYISRLLLKMLDLSSQQDSYSKATEAASRQASVPPQSLASTHEAAGKEELVRQRLSLSRYSST